MEPSQSAPTTGGTASWQSGYSVPPSHRPSVLVAYRSRGMLLADLDAGPAAKAWVHGVDNQDTSQLSSLAEKAIATVSKVVTTADQRYPARIYGNNATQVDEEAQSEIARLNEEAQNNPSFGGASVHIVSNEQMTAAHTLLMNRNSTDATTGIILKPDPLKWPETERYSLPTGPETWRLYVNPSRDPNTTENRRRQLHAAARWEIHPGGSPADFDGISIFWADQHAFDLPFLESLQLGGDTSLA